MSRVEKRPGPFCKTWEFLALSSRNYKNLRQNKSNVIGSGKLPNTLVRHKAAGDFG